VTADTARALSRFSRVFVIDDNSYDNEYATIVLGRAGFGDRVQVFLDGQSALRELTSATYADPVLILVDIKMPGIDGFEFARRLAQQEILPELTVVILTSSPDPTDLQTAGTIPIIQHYLSKPLRVPLLADLLTRDLPAAGRPR